MVSVRDQGIGIDAELLPRIFDLFAQGKRGLDRAQGGLGVGLTLARRLTEMHGGQIEAFSEGRDQGSEFRLRLPCVGLVAPAGAAGARRGARPRRAEAPAHPGRRRQPRRGRPASPRCSSWKATQVRTAARRRGGAGGRGGLPARRRGAGHRPAAARRLRGGAPAAPGASRPRRAADRADRLRPAARTARPRWTPASTTTSSSRRIPMRCWRAFRSGMNSAAAARTPRPREAVHQLLRLDPDLLDRLRTSPARCGRPPAPCRAC